MSALDYKLNANRTVVVSTVFALKPIDKTTPVGAKCLLFSEEYGVTHIGNYNPSADPFYTHWAPMPYHAKTEVKS